MKFINIIKAKLNKVVRAVKSVLMTRRTLLTAKSGEGYIDVAVKIIIGVVIGGIILVGLYALFDSSILPTLESKISSMFSYSGIVE